MIKLVPEIVYTDVMDIPIGNIFRLGGTMWVRTSFPEVHFETADQSGSTVAKNVVGVCVDGRDKFQTLAMTDNEVLCPHGHPGRKCENLGRIEYAAKA
ncbi:TPA: hypothetical protein SIF59_004267 [Escherichia coli]|nr:hypothetical protein [Escherichia coli]